MTSKSVRSELDRHEVLLIALIKGLRELQQVRDQHSQAILELAAALREAGITAEGVVLPSTSEEPVPASQNADR